MYWAILSRLLYKKKIPAISPLFVNGKFVSDFCEKANLFQNFFCVNMYANKKIQVYCLCFHIGPAPE